MNERRNHFKAGYLLLAAVLFFTLPAGVASAEIGRDYTWSQKMGRGLGNVVTGVFEIPREIHYTSEESNIGTGWTLGLLKGVGVGIVRIGTGLVDFVTFPFDFPDENKAPLITPEFAWDSGRTQL